MSEIPERYLEQARDNKAADLLHDMLLGENFEWLCGEIERMLLSKDRADIDGLEDLNIKDIATRICEAEADRMMECGDLDEKATDIAVGAAEDRSDYFQDR
jgi:hypothetical protein